MSRQFSSHQEHYPARGGGTLGADRKAATALVFQDVVVGVASTVAIQGDDGSIIAIQATALNTDQIIINAAIVYVIGLGGGQIFIDEGVYNIVLSVDESYIVVATNVTIRGAGIGNTILRASGTVTNGVSVYMIRMREDTAISDLTIDMDGANLTYDSPYVAAWYGGIIVGDTVAEARRAIVESVMVVNAWVPAVVVGLNSVGVALFWGEGATVRNLYVEDSFWALVITHRDLSGLNSDYIVDGLVVDNCDEGGIYWEWGEAIINNVIVRETARALYQLAITGKITNGIVDNLKAYNCTENAISIGVQEAGDVILSNILVNATAATRHGLNIVTGNVTLNNVIVREAGGDGILVYGDQITIQGGIIDKCGYHGIETTTNASVIVNDMIISNNSQAAGNTYSGIALADGSDNSIVNGCKIFDDQVTETQRRGIIITDSDYVIASDNRITGHTQLGIIETGTSDYSSIYDNNLLGNTIGSLTLIGINTTAFHNKVDGTNTITDGVNIPSIQMPFIQGTTFISTADNPWGWEIDADTEFAIALGQLPLEVQQVVRIKIWAVGLVNPGVVDAYMRSQFTGEAAASDEVYTTNSIDVVDKNCVENNPAANDVIHWMLDPTDDADIGNLLGGDSIQFKVLHEGGAGDDIETDAIFRCVEIEYL